MKKRRAHTNRFVYGAILGMNLAVATMFTAVLFPREKTEYAYAATHIPAKPPILKTREAVVGTPNRVVVSNVAIDIPVTPGLYESESQTWTIGYGTAYHADRSVPSNDSNGNTLIYGHADWAVFGKVVDLKEGSTATVYTNEGTVFTYTFESNVQVEPNDTSVLNSSGPPKLVLQTCSGPFDIYRTLVTFKLTGVKKP